MWHAMNAIALMRDHPEFDDRWNVKHQMTNAEHRSTPKDMRTLLREAAQSMAPLPAPDIQGRDV
jgi:hypothetical protein